MIAVSVICWIFLIKVITCITVRFQGNMYTFLEPNMLYYIVFKKQIPFVRWCLGVIQHKKNICTPGTRLVLQRDNVTFSKIAGVRLTYISESQNCLGKG